MKADWLDAPLVLWDLAEPFSSCHLTTLPPFPTFPPHYPPTFPTFPAHYSPLFFPPSQLTTLPLFWLTILPTSNRSPMFFH